MLKPGDFVGPYEIRGFVGQGGMGQVYKAFDPRLERTVALKVIIVTPTSPDSVRTRAGVKHESERGIELNPQLSSRWLREARAVASLSHPNVVAIYDVGETGGRLWLAMEYVVGSPLRNLVGDPDLPLPRRIRFLVEVARALEAAHRSGIVHRDIKPENVMIREDGAVKVLDFGIARRTVAKTPDEQHKVDTVTGGGAISGTPVYMAPEMIKGGDVDWRCDQFAWGVMAYELVTGGRPWNESGDVLSIVANILTENPAPIRGKVKDVPVLVDESIMRALAKDPNARFKSMADVADALEPFAATNTSGDRVRVTTSPHHDDAFAETTKVPTTVTVPPKASEVTAVEPALSSKKRARQLAIPLFLLGALGATVYLTTRPKEPPTTRVPAIPSVTPRPLSENPQAEAAYNDAKRAWHDGALTASRTAFERAIELDPDFAAAHLELALEDSSTDRAAAQAEFSLAFAHRQMMLPRDEMLLDASQPFIRPTGQLPDLAEWETRMTAVVFQHPRDPEFHFWLGRARQQQGEDADAAKAFQDALKIDDSYAPALAWLARTQVKAGDMKRALDLTEGCVKRSPIAAVCVEARYEFRFSANQCKEARSEAANWSALEPKSPRPFAALARALEATGAPRPSVEETLSRRWALVPQAEQKRDELWDRAFLSVTDGDFAKTDDLAREYDAALPFDADSEDHAKPSKLRMNILHESERDKDAAKVAHNFLDRMAAWPAYPFAPDPSLDFYEMLYRTGEMTKKELDTKREEWREGEQKRARDGHAARGPWVDWLSIYASFAETREEAQEALTQAPRIPPTGGLGIDYALGKLYALTNRWDDAIPPLKRVIATCNTFESMIIVQKARLFLGEAQEAKGDIKSARAEYQKILDQWPKTTGSRTSKRAAERLVALPKE